MLLLLWANKERLAPKLELTTIERHQYGNHNRQAVCLEDISDKHCPN